MNVVYQKKLFMTAVLRLLFGVITCAFSLVGFAQTGDWQQELRYKIDVSLNDSVHALTGYMQLTYKNNSPDTLSYIWFHVWPNAFKNDKTAYSEHQLSKGNTSFYFSGSAERAYINRLDFRTGITSLEIADHPVHTDIIQVILSQPLLPGQATTITTPFYVKLPRNFDGFGHDGLGEQSYQLNNWHPVAAVYDKEGWHTMPFLERNFVFNEFAWYEIELTLPRNYIVASNAELKNEDELQWLKTRTTAPILPKIKTPAQKQSFKKQPSQLEAIPSDRSTKTLRYTTGADQVWFLADKHFWIETAVVQQASGKNLDILLFHKPGKNSPKPVVSIDNVIDATRFNSGWLIDYPLPVLSIADHIVPVKDSRASTTNTQSDVQRHVTRVWLTALSLYKEPYILDGLIDYINTKFRQSKSDLTYVSFLSGDKRLNRARTLQQSAYKQNQSQPLNTRIDSVNPANARLMPAMSADWLRMIESQIGGIAFQKAIRELLLKRQFKSIDQQQLTLSLKENTDVGLTSVTEVPQTIGRLPADTISSRIVLEPFFERNPDPSRSVIYISPMAGYNTSDGFMAGAAAHNYGLKFNRFRFFASGLYGFQSKQLNGLADLGYTWQPAGSKQQIRIGSGFARFSTLTGIDSNGHRVSAGFIKFTPNMRWEFHGASSLNIFHKWIEWKTYVIGESGFRYQQKSTDGEYYPSTSDVQFRYINQLTFGINNDRVLYPFAANIQGQQAKDFFRINLNADFFFNYPVGGGVAIRLFAAGFGYIGNRSASSAFTTARYQPKLTAVRGAEDYTYSNYFIGRNESDGLPAQQMMLRDGGLKIRTDLFQDMQGRSDSWVSSINLSSTLPIAALPSGLPIRLFFDIGTYAEAWKEDATGTRFLYTGGVQLSLFKNVLNIYAPVVYSKAFRDVLKTVPEENKFLRKLSFTIDIQKVVSKKNGQPIID